tara:strand:+ start:781 stop:984 length:204 start_codon:yes stop_codon:yes gene_type:complete
MDTGIARLSYINAHKKLAAKNKLKQEPSKDVKNSLLTKPDSGKINGYEDDDAAVFLLERVLKGFNNA